MTNGFMNVCGDTELDEGAVKTVSIDDKLILLARYNGAVYAVDDICTHDGGELGDGDLVDCQIQCPRHGARFDLKTGAATRMPAIIGIETYEVKVKDGRIFVAVDK
ncbi:MAG: non-heme iron oxygenase ferredoxin subunit [candidate division Zixibacteria bacterium]